jgi:hypothetical protein
MACTWTTISIYYKKLQKNCSKTHLYEKVFFGKKDIESFSKVIMLFRCISFAPHFPLSIQQIASYLL